jgi:signal transduction histidine kinase
VGTLVRRREVHRVPLRVRLALAYGGLTGLVVLLVSLLAYAEHTRGHYDDVDRSLTGAAEHVSGREADEALAHGDLAAALAVPVEPDVALRVYDGDGRVIAAGPNAALAPAIDPRTFGGSAAAYDPVAGLAPPLIPVGAAPGSSFGLASAANGGRWRVYVLPAPVGAPYAYMVASAPLDRIDASIDGFRALMLLGTALGAIATFVVGSLLAGRALRPVSALTNTARAIASSRDFERRVPVGPRQDELGRLADTFNEMLASLEQAYTAQQRFVSDASHELRAPLTAIQANLDLLERRRELSPVERQEAVSEAAREARRLSLLVAELLAIARADAGVALHREPVEVDRVLLETVGEARHLEGGQRLEVGVLEPSVVIGDPDRLKQLLLVLMDNALKYTPPSGRVIVSLRRDGDKVQLAVEDTGVGISPDDLPHVFDRFYRADPARSRDPGGTGLGLPIARWIARQHGGDVTLASMTGRGTTATVDLPSAR